MTYKKGTILSVAGYLLMVAGLLLLYFNHSLFSLSPVVILLQAAAVVLMVWARMTFKARSFHLAANPTEGGLVTTGPYKYVRHPIYAAVLLFVWSAIAGNVSIGNVLVGFVVIAGTMMRIVCEEPLVLEKYPEYRQYAERTKRLIPYVY